MRRRFVIRVYDGVDTVKFSGTNLKSILRAIENKFEGGRKRGNLRNNKKTT